MSPKDFFRIVIKLTALFVICFGIVPVMANLFFITGYEFSIEMAIVLLIVIMIFVLFVIAILNRPDKIIGFFKLDQGFDSDSFNFSNVESKYIIEIACAIIGLIFILSSTPKVLYEAFMYFKYNVSYESSGPFSLDLYNEREFYIEIIFLILGLIVLNYRKWISEKLG
ncbi:hypothetical protein [uncultured Winogradskyella sp.]|uniref:hypothetical protein n=1 Tax=uncultured Winogradskyella sp. TaxID=395353 RepID=UPI002616374F|nr:hypothetical protein [uncultured Winogradskyella sp.]